MINTYNEIKVEDWSVILQYAKNKFGLEYVLENMFTMRDHSGNTLFTMAICMEKFDLAKYLIKKGSNVNDRIAGEDRHTAFTWVALLENFEMLDYLLDHGADINAQTSDGRTALHYAIQGGNLKNVKFLMKKKANFLLKDKNGLTPFDYLKLPGVRKEILKYINEFQKKYLARFQDILETRNEK